MTVQKRKNTYEDDTNIWDIGERRLQAAHGQTDRQSTWGNAATYRGVKEFQNSLQVKVIGSDIGDTEDRTITNHTQYFTPHTFSVHLTDSKLVRSAVLHKQIMYTEAIATVFVFFQFQIARIASNTYDRYNLNKKSHALFHSHRDVNTINKHCTLSYRQ